jgi:hypothetical protein
VGQGRSTRVRLQSAARLRPRRRAGTLRPVGETRVRLVLRRRRLHQQLGDDRLWGFRDRAREPALSREASARRRQDDARALPGSGLHPVVREVPLWLLPRGHDAALRPRGLGLRSRELGSRVRPRDLALDPEGLRVLRLDGRGRRRSHGQHPGGPGRGRDRDAALDGRTDRRVSRRPDRGDLPSEMARLSASATSARRARRTSGPSPL